MSATPPQAALPSLDPTLGAALVGLVVSTRFGTAVYFIR